MTDDPREILRAAEVECPEVERRGRWRDYIGSSACRHGCCNDCEFGPSCDSGDHDAAVLALARLVAKYKAESERLKVCGNCAYSDTDFDSALWCYQETTASVNPSDHCRFTPSQWKEKT